MTLYSHEIEIARKAAWQAAALCLAVQAEAEQGLGGMEKAGREPVTVADYGSQALILSLIAREFPSDAVFAEERSDEFDSVATDIQRERVRQHISRIMGTEVNASSIKSWLDHGRSSVSNRAWAIDPIDGTKGFLRRDQFAIAIALLVDGNPVVSALACPVFPVDPANSSGALGVIASAVKGEGAVIEELNGTNHRALKVSVQANLSAARIVESVESGHSDHDFSASVLKLAGVAGQPVRMDSQAKYAAVADGRAEIYLRHSQGEGYTEKIWDHAAGVLVVTEAGGKVTDLNGKPLDFSKGGRLSGNHGILATNGHLHGALLDAIQNAK
jgi:3'(2'), 5'-bisphosphate nucleotidase